MFGPALPIVTRSEVAWCVAGAPLRSGADEEGGLNFVPEQKTLRSVPESGEARSDLQRRPALGLDQVFAALVAASEESAPQARQEEGPFDQAQGRASSLWRFLREVTKNRGGASSLK